MCIFTPDIPPMPEIQTPAVQETEAPKVKPEEVQIGGTSSESRKRKRLGTSIFKDTTYGSGGTGTGLML